MSRRIDLPGGGWAEIREPSELRIRHRRIITAASMAAGSALAKVPDPPTHPDPKKAESLRAEWSKQTRLDQLGLSFEEAEAMLGIQEATVVAFLAAWSFGAELPTMATVGDMDPAVFDAISEATAADGAEVAKESGAFGPDGVTDPDSPTGASAGSASGGSGSTSKSTRR